MLRLEDLLDARMQLQAQAAELGAAVIDGGQAHRAQDAVGHRTGPGDLQEVPACGVLVQREHGNSFPSEVLHANPDAA